jgi:AraC-like DNA-binding protein
MAPDDHRAGAVLLRPKHLAVRIASWRQLDDFNRTDEIPVRLEVPASTVPTITITGHQTETLSVWETRSACGFVTTPRQTADLVTIRFVTQGQLVYRHRRGDLRGSPTHATLAAFEGLREVQAPDSVVALNGSIAVPVLAAAHRALTGEDRNVPSLAPVADMSAAGMRALFCTLTQVHRRLAGSARGDDDLLLPLVRDMVSYQLLSAWPKGGEAVEDGGPAVSSRSLGIALDYIRSNLTHPLTLGEVARTAGISVRSLQDKFRREMGQTPVKFIIDQRLARAHDDLRSPSEAATSIADIARRWGFVHISDFGQRYRRAYHRTPSETRREAGCAG